MSKKQKPRVVHVSERAGAALDRIVGLARSNQKQVIETLLEWLSEQNDEHIAAIVSAVPRSRKRDYARIVLESWISQSAETDTDRPSSEASSALAELESASTSGRSASGRAKKAGGKSRGQTG